MKIEYRIEGNTVATMDHGLPVDPSAASVVAQKYMKQFRAIESAHLFYPHEEYGMCERVVSRSTEWNKRNG